MPRTTYLVSTIGAVTFSRMTASICELWVLASRPSSPMPALLTRPQTWPCSAFSVRTSSGMASTSERSKPKKRILPFAAAIAASSASP